MSSVRHLSSINICHKPSNSPSYVNLAIWATAKICQNLGSWRVVFETFFFEIELGQQKPKNWRLGAKKNQILTVAHIVSLKLIQWSSHSPWLHLCAAIYGVPWIPSRLTPVMLAFFYHLPAPAGSVMGWYPASLFVTQNHPIESREPTTFIELDGKNFNRKARSIWWYKLTIFRWFSGWPFFPTKPIHW